MVLASALAGPALAHHSFAMFDQKKVLTLEGTVTEFQWTNPHSFLEVDVPQGGKAVAEQLLAGAKTSAENAFKIPLVQRTLESVLAEAKKG